MKKTLDKLFTVVPFANSFQIDRRCSLDSISTKLEDANQNQTVQFHCTCPGCTLYSYLAVIILVCAVSCCGVLVLMKIRQKRSNRSTADVLRGSGDSQKFDTQETYM